MANKAGEMLRDSMDSLVERDLVKAENVMDDDDEVDDLYDQVYRELLLFMIQDPGASSGPPTCYGLLTTWNALPTGPLISPSG